MSCDVMSLTTDTGHFRRVLRRFSCLLVRRRLDLRGSSLPLEFSLRCQVDDFGVEMASGRFGCRPRQEAGRLRQVRRQGPGRPGCPPPEIRRRVRPNRRFTPGRLRPRYTVRGDGSGILFPIEVPKQVAKGYLLATLSELIQPQPRQITVTISPDKMLKNH